MVTSVFLVTRGQSLLQKNIRTAIVLTTLVNLLDVITTYYSSGPELKYEGNYWVVHHGFGWPGLLFMLLLWQWFTVVLYAYHKNGFGPVRYQSNRILTMVSDFFLRNSSITPFRGRPLNVALSVLCAIISYYGLWSTYWYVANKIFLFFNNVMLGFVHNNAVVESVPGRALIEITINDHPLWDTFVKDIVIRYYHLSVNSNQLMLNVIYWSISTIVLLTFFRREYRHASRTSS